MAIKISQFNSLPTVDGTIIVPVVDPSPSNTSFRTTVADLQTFILNGNAATADKLYQPVNINSVAFDGSADITVTADASTLTGTTLNSTILSSSLTSVGTLTNLTVTNTISGSVNGSSGSVGAANITGTTLASGVTGSSLTSVGTLLNLTVTNTISGSVNGNAGTVTNGVYTTDTGTVTNTMLAGSIANNKLTNNSVTFNGVTVALGASGSITADIPVATTSVLGGVIVGEGLAVQLDGTLSVAITKLFHGFSVNTTGDLIYSTTTDSTINLQNQYGEDIYESVDIGTDEYSYSMDAGGNLIVTFA